MPKKASLYVSPECEFQETRWEALICDSYNSGLEDFEYEEIDRTVKP